MSISPTNQVELGRSKAIILAILSIAQFMIALDYSIVYVALPDIAGNLQIGEAASQWIFSAYGLFFAGFLLAGGRICDRYGSSKVFVVAILVFGAASLLGGLAASGGYLLLGRALQGVSAAALQPAIIALITLNFEEGKSRSRALSIWGAVGASGLVAGVVMGGFLTVLSWRLIFIVNVPIALLCVWLGATHFVKERAVSKRVEIPIPSSILGTVAILTSVFALTLIAEDGFVPPLTKVSIALSIVFLATFLIAEKKLSSPLVSRDLRHIRSLKIGCVASGLYMASVGAEFFLLTLLLQDFYGFDVLSVGLMFLPLSITIILGNIIAGRIIGRFSAANVLSFGFVLGAGGLAYIAVFLGSFNYTLGILPGLILSGIGHGIIYTSKYVVGTRETPEAQQGIASSLMIVSQYGSGSLALAILVLIMAAGSGANSYILAFIATALFALIGAVVALMDKERKGA